MKWIQLAMNNLMKKFAVKRVNYYLFISVPYSIIRGVVTKADVAMVTTLYIFSNDYKAYIKQTKVNLNVQAIENGGMFS